MVSIQTDAGCMSALCLLCQRVCFSGKLDSSVAAKKDALQKVWMGEHVSEALLCPEPRSARQEDLGRLRGSWKQAPVH